MKKHHCWCNTQLNSGECNCNEIKKNEAGIQKLEKQLNDAKYSVKNHYRVLYCDSTENTIVAVDFQEASVFGQAIHNASPISKIIWLGVILLK